MPFCSASATRLKSLKASMMLLRYECRYLDLHDHGLGHAVECRMIGAMARERARHNQISFASQAFREQSRAFGPVLQR